MDTITRKDVNIIGRILIIQFKEQDLLVFDEVMEFLNQYPCFEYLRIKDEPMVSLPGLEIYPNRHKIYRDRREINLTAKEYGILALLVANKGSVLTYDQIYQKVWGEEGVGSEHNTVGCQVRNIREKLYEAEPDAPFSIRCVREVEQRFELNHEWKLYIITVWEISNCFFLPFSGFDLRRYSAKIV